MLNPSRYKFIPGWPIFKLILTALNRSLSALSCFCFHLANVKRAYCFLSNAFYKCKTRAMKDTVDKKGLDGQATWFELKISYTNDF